MPNETQVISHTNQRLESWYTSAKEDFDLDGHGEASLTSDGSILIEYTENGRKKTFTVEYWEGESLDYVFNVWSENAQ